MDLKFKRSNRQQIQEHKNSVQCSTETFVSTTVNVLCVFGSKTLRPPSCQHFSFYMTEAKRDNTDRKKACHRVLTQSRQKMSFAQLISWVQTSDLPSLTTRFHLGSYIGGVKLPTRGCVTFVLTDFISEWDWRQGEDGHSDVLVAQLTLWKQTSLDKCLSLYVVRRKQR